MTDRLHAPRQPLQDFLIAALAITLLPLGAASLPQTVTKHSLADLAWIAGNWVLETPRSRTEERWTDIVGNMALGVSRTTAGGKTVFFEFLRIEERVDGIYYVAQPKGQPPTDFKLTQLEGQKAVFENPAHDFPKRILYWRNADGSMTARIDGGAESKQAQEFPFKLAK